jgi:hypothetical protein
MVSRPNYGCLAAAIIGLLVLAAVGTCGLNIGPDLGGLGIVIAGICAVGALVLVFYIFLGSWK